MSQALLEIHDLHFTYDPGSDRALPALRGIDLEIQAGEYVAIIGHNGSGKSTLARHFNALLLPTQGEVLVQGMNTRDHQLHQAIRYTVGMVFQNPDNQIVATVVEEDVAFGPENLALPLEELRNRVDWALEVVGLSHLRLRSPHHLSAGQRQRLALAGALAMRPACLVLDEATAMLDPAGRRAVRRILQQLHAQGMTIITITQRMEEAVDAQRIIALSHGQVALDGPPVEVFADRAALQQLGLDLPLAARFAQMLGEHLPDFPADVLTPTALVSVLKEHARARGSR